MKTCQYCYEWNRSQVIKVLDKQGRVSKRCSETGNTIESIDTACKKFKPCTHFFCERNEFFVTFEICRNRYNKCKFGDRKEQGLYSSCEKCKQYKHIIKPICNEFKISTPQIVKIKRRDAPKEIEIKFWRTKKNIIKHRSRS